MAAVQAALAVTLFVVWLLPSRRIAKPEKHERRGASMRRHVILAGVGVYLLYLVTSLNVHVAHPAPLHELAQQKARVEMTGTVSSRVDERVSPWGAPSCQADITVQRKQTGALINVDPLVRVVGLPCDVLQGQHVQLEGKLSPLEHSDRPAALMYASNVTVTGLPRPSARVVATIERDLTALIATRPDHVTGLLPGVSLGDPSKISPDLSAAMKLTQLTHLIAVSGDTDDYRGALLPSRAGD